MGLEAVKLIEEVKNWCNILGSAHNWIWSDSSIAKPLRFPNLPLLESQGLIMVGSNLTFKAELLPSCPSLPDLYKALILHPVHFNFACTHPEYNTFTSLNNIPDLLTYSNKYLLADDLLALHQYGIIVGGVIETGEGEGVMLWILNIYIYISFLILYLKVLRIAYVELFLSRFPLYLLEVSITSPVN